MSISGKCTYKNHDACRQLNCYCKCHPKPEWKLPDSDEQPVEVVRPKGRLRRMIRLRKD